MKDKTQIFKIREFVKTWSDPKRGGEKQDSQVFWTSLLGDVFGVENVANFIKFEEKVKVDNTNFIDGHIENSKVIIEQKSRGKDLRKAIKQSDGTYLNPYQQAKRYSSELPLSQHPKWIVLSNFDEFHVYDMEKPQGDPEIIYLKDLERDYYRLNFLIDNRQDEVLQREMEISIQAGEIVGRLYDAILKEYKNPKNPETLKSLNELVVRIVFCLYAEDSGIFDTHLQFHDYMEGRRNPRGALIELFKVLDTPYDERDPYLDEDLLSFPYVNGGLFANHGTEIPRLNPEIMEIILHEASEDFNWSEISPTIFGAVFESTLNPETRRSGGMHYTSLENIHKVIDPLFLDALSSEFEEIKDITSKSLRTRKLKEFQKRISDLKFLDPACGSGNFLTETYLSLRKLENEILKLLLGDQIMFGLGEEYDPIQVSLDQFYGIEINDFAVSVARTALWIAEHQMMRKTEEILHSALDFLPLKTFTNIHEGNSLRMDWNDVIPSNQLNYIMGNPPFVGQAMRSPSQSEDLKSVFLPSKSWGKLDYVSGWFRKSADFIGNTNIEVAFVSSNSICQGESVNLLWKPLLTEEGFHINFAYTTFLWTSEASVKASVMCVIIGFSKHERAQKFIYDDNHQKKQVNHINGYLNDASDIFIKNRSKSINKNGLKVCQGSPPADDGKLLLSKSEKDWFITKYPELKNVIKPFVGSREFLNETEFVRFCFWFADEEPYEYAHIKELTERFNYIREYRLKSSVDRIQKTADKPYLFTQNRQPSTKYLFIPRTSSSNRKYIPMGFLEPDVIASDSAVVISNASLFDFGLLNSNVHNAWMQTIAGRFKNDYRYAPSVYYNFPIPKISAEDRQKIENSALDILKARKKYESKTLAEMYGEKMYTFPDLVEAHRKNDKAVMDAYGFPWKGPNKMLASDCVGELMKMYQKLVEQDSKKK